jgi:hypothetical protein
MINSVGPEGPFTERTQHAEGQIPQYAYFDTPAMWNQALLADHF